MEKGPGKQGALQLAPILQHPPEWRHNSAPPPELDYPALPELRGREHGALADARQPWGTCASPEVAALGPPLSFTARQCQVLVSRCLCSRCPWHSGGQRRCSHVRPGRGSCLCSSPASCGWRALLVFLFYLFIYLFTKSEVVVPCPAAAAAAAAACHRSNCQHAQTRGWGGVCYSQQRRSSAHIVLCSGDGRAQGAVQALPPARSADLHAVPRQLTRSATASHLCTAPS